MHLRLLFQIVLFSGLFAVLGRSVQGGEIKDGWPERLAFQAEVRAMLQQERFDELGVLGRRLRESREKFSEGLEKRYDFLEGISEPLARHRDESWMEWLSKFDRWEHAQPGNLDVLLGRAKTLVDFAWKARGNGGASRVRDEQWKRFEERLGLAKDLIDEILRTHPADAEAAMVLHTIAMGLNWTPAEKLAVFERGIAANRNYFRLYTQRALSLLPRWGGKPGEWQDFAARSADKNPELGDELYARIAWAFREFHGRDFFVESGIDWPRMRKGFELMMLRYPQSLWNLNAFVWFACRANDRLTARVLFTRLGENWHCSFWCGNEFHQCRDWAMRDGNDPAPFLKTR